MDRLHVGFLASALSELQRLFQVSVEPAAFEEIDIAASRRDFQSKVDAHGILFGRKLSLDVDNDVKIPANMDILIEAVGPEVEVRQALPAPDLKMLLVGNHPAVFS